MKKIFNLNMKAVVAVGIVVLLVFAGIPAGARIISDAVDTAVLQISNSRGDHYSVVNQSNLQRATWNCNVTFGGWVMLPQGHGLNTAILDNPWNVAFINMSGYNSTRWTSTSTQLDAWRVLWNSTRSIVSAKSATWNATAANLVTYGLLWNATRSVVTGKSLIWNTTATNLVSYGLLWNNTRSVVSAKSATWNSSASVVSAKSATWNATSSNLISYGLLWNATRSLLISSGLLWNSTRAVVLAKSATWNLTSTQLASWSALWNSTRSVVSAKSDIWNSTSSLVASKSAGWNASNATLIRANNGNSWTATGANAQIAVNSLNNLTGSVYIPSMIAITNTIYVGEGCTLYSDGQGGFTQGNNNNKTLLKNYNGRDDITIKGLRFEGNGMNQPEWWHIAAWTMFCYGIYFTGCSNVRIENCFINDSACGGILIYQGDNITIQDNRIWNSGKLYKDSGHAYTQWQANQIYTYNCSNILIKDNICFYSYACGIVVEGELSSPMNWRNYNWIVDGNTVTDTGYGYYFEDTRDGLCNDNIAYYCDDIQVYATAAGYRLAPACTRITLSDNKAYNCVYGYQNGAYNITFNGCESYSASIAGTGDFYNSGIYNRFIDCISDGSASTGFYNDAGGYNVTFDGCHVYDAVSYGVKISSWTLSRKAGWATIQNCVFDDAGSYDILCYGSNTTISNNILRESVYGILIDSCENITIRNNDISKVGSRAIRLTTVSRGLISGNYINKETTSGSHGVYLSICKNISVMWNVFQGTGSDYPQYGVYEAGACRNNWILFNKGIGIGTLVTISGTGFGTKVNCSTNADTVWNDWNFDI